MTIRDWIRTGRLIFFLLLTPFCCAQQSQIQISSPADGSTVLEGQALPITVSADPSVQVIGVLTDGDLPDLLVGPSSNQFLQPLPTTIRPGVYHLTAIGITTDGPVESLPITITVEPQTYPINLKTDPLLLIFESVGDTLPITVIGTFTDFSNLDVTYSSHTTYSSKDSAIASVDNRGIVTAQAPGETYILISTNDPNPAISKPHAAVIVRVPGAPFKIASFGDFEWVWQCRAKRLQDFVFDVAFEFCIPISELVPTFPDDFS